MLKFDKNYKSKKKNYLKKKNVLFELLEFKTNL